MSQVKMPEPVTWVRQHPDGALTAEFLENEVIEPVRKQSGAWKPLITTTQAEAYADARVREALEEAAAIADQKSRIGVLRSLEATHKSDAAREIAGAIRALIPQQ